jgi:hypothetical protein
MKENPLHEGAFMIHGEGVGTVSPEMIGKRAAELAVINGRQLHEATMADWDEAVRELTGGNELDPKQEFLESVPESDRWNPIPGSSGHEAMVDFNDGEDKDGRSAEERLFEEGVEEAVHDLMLEATSKKTLPEE